MAKQNKPDKETKAKSFAEARKARQEKEKALKDKIKVSQVSILEKRIARDQEKLNKLKE